MVIAYHSIFSMYGFWLPNDPRGSYSDFVASWNLCREGGKATKVTATRSVASRPHNRDERSRVKNALQFPPVDLNDEQIECVAAGFAEAVRKSGYEIYKCSLLPNHVHAVIGRHELIIEKVVAHLKAEGTMALVRTALHPFQNLQRPGGRLVSCWTDKGWNVFLNSDAEVVRAIEYVRANPMKEGRAEQFWPFERRYASASYTSRPDERAG